MVKAGLMPSSASTSTLPHPPEQQPIIDHFLPVSRHTTPILASPSFRLPLQNSSHHLRSLSSGTSISVISVILFLFPVPLGHCGPLTGHPTRCPSHQTKKQKVTEPRPAAPKLWDAPLFEWSAASSVGILKNVQLKRHLFKARIPAELIVLTLYLSATLMLFDRIVALIPIF